MAAECGNNGALSEASVPSTAPELSDFVYVDTATGGVGRRNRVMRVDRFFPPPGATDVFTTYFRFTKDFQAYTAKNPSPTSGKPPSVANYPGPALALYFPVDFDCEADPAKALADAGRCIQAWHARYDLPIEPVRISWSGHKGIGLEIPGSLFGGFRPSPGIADLMKRLAEALLAGAETADLSIYEKLRLWRVVNTRHGASGLFKIPLTPAELLAADLEAIRALATSPRQLPQPSDDDWQPVPDLVELRLDTVLETAPRRNGQVAESTSDASGRVATATFLARAVRLAREGHGRNNSGLWLACQLRDNRYSQDEAEPVLLDYVAKAPAANLLGQTEPYAESEALKSLQQAFSRPPREPWGKGSTTVQRVVVGAAHSPWEEPDEIWGPPPAPPLPLQLFPREIADVAEDTAERQQAPIDFVAWPLVVSSAGLIGPSAGIRPRAFDDWTERPCLWFAGIAPPSWMKSPAIEEGIRPLRRQHQKDHDAYAADMLAWAQLCASLKAANPKIPVSELPPEPVMQRCLAADATVEKLAMLMQPENRRGLTLHRDELAGLVLDMNKYRQKGGDLQFYLQAYTGGPYAVDRVSRGSLFVPDLFLNVVGGIQPDLAREVFGSGPDDGFAARFTSAWPDLAPTFRSVDRWPNKTARDALDFMNDVLVTTGWDLVLMVDDFKPTAFCRLDPDGQRLFDEWREALMTDLRAGVYADSRHASRVGKYPGLAARLTLVFHAVEWAVGRTEDPRSVAGATVARALELVDDYVLPMERRVYAAYAVPADAEGGRRIARWIKDTRPERFTAREILRHDWSGLQTAAAVAASLDWLVTHRWLREAEPEARPGRPSNVFLVNPQVGDSHG